jgi:hypothetical protein
LDCLDQAITSVRHPADARLLQRRRQALQALPPQAW